MVKVSRQHQIKLPREREKKSDQIDRCQSLTVKKSMQGDYIVTSFLLIKFDLHERCFLKLSLSSALGFFPLRLVLFLLTRFYCFLNASYFSI